MRHRNHKHSLGLTTEHRASLLSNLAAALIEHGRIQTTLAKAKALRPFVEKVITKAKKAAAYQRDDKGRLDPRALALRRLAMTKVRNKDAVAKLFNEKVTEFMKRPGGYTRIYKLATPRLGDAASMAIIELVKADEIPYGRRSAQKSASAT